jgi:hypothetical protein
MKKFHIEEARRLSTLDSAASSDGSTQSAGGVSAYSGLPRSDELRALVKFAINQGYYDLWNKSIDDGVSYCSSTDFSTDRNRVSR